MHGGALFTFARKNLPKASLADFPFEGSTFGSSFGAVFAALADVSPLGSILGGSGGGGGGTDIPFGAAGGSDTCATYSGRHDASQMSTFSLPTHLNHRKMQVSV